MAVKRLVAMLVVLLGWTPVLEAASQSEPAAAARPLQEIALRTVGPSQGIYMEGEDGTVLAAVHAERPVHPASVTKVATTLALLRQLGPDYRFDTVLSVTGPILDDGTVAGDLVVESRGDPFFISESAFLVLAELRRLGIRRVAGTVTVDGNFLFNWHVDRRAERLKRALTGLDAGPGWAVVQGWRSELAGRGAHEIGLEFDPTLAQRTTSERTRVISYRSPPLIAMLKAFNAYSNNVMHPLSVEIGGPQAVERIARESVAPELRDEIVITNAAGAGRTNRMSPRAAAAIVRALAAEAVRHDLRLVDLLPVSGIDAGTLNERLSDESSRGVVVGKTGTYGSIGIVSLAGVVGTGRFGNVTFAILNTGLSVPEGRARQDALLHALLDQAGAVPFDYRAPLEEPMHMARLEALVAPCCGAGERDAPEQGEETR